MQENGFCSDEASYSSKQEHDLLAFNKIDKTDYYALLGVDRTADLPTIRKAYKKLALKFHPDKNMAPGADEAFKLISKAFTVLSDENSRTRYDSFGASQASHFRSDQPEFSEVSPEQLFEMFFKQFSGEKFPFAQTGRHAGGHFSASPFFFSSSFFNGGFSTERRHPHPFRDEEDEAEQDEMQLVYARLVQLLPLLLVILLSYIGTLFS